MYVISEVKLKKGDSCYLEIVAWVVEVRVRWVETEGSPIGLVHLRQLVGAASFVVQGACHLAQLEVGLVGHQTLSGVEAHSLG